MVDVTDHKRKIAETEEQLKTATGHRRTDLLKYMKRLERELRAFEKWKKYGKTA